MAAKQFFLCFEGVQIADLSYIFGSVPTPSPEKKSCNISSPACCTPFAFQYGLNFGFGLCCGSKV